MAMSLAHRPLFEHWTEVRPAPGATSPAMFDEDDIVEGGEIVRQLDSSGTSRLVVRDTASPLATLKHLDVIRLIDPFDDPYDLRVIGVNDGDGVGHRLVTLTLAPIAQDLKIDIVRDEVSGASPILMIAAQDRTPLEIITDFVIPALQAAGVSWITIGTVEFTQRISVPAGIRTPLGWMRELEDATEGEFYLDDNYALHLVEQINSTVDPIPLEIGVNLDAIDRERGGATVTTVVVPLGAVPTNSEEPATRRHAVWRVTAVTVDTLTLAAPRGGRDLVAKAGIWVGKYALANDGTLYEIESSTTPNKITLESGGGANFSIGEDIEIRADASGTPLIEIADSDFKRWVRTAENDRLRGERNQVRVPYGDTWPNGNGSAMTCRCDGGSAGASLPLKLLRPNAVIADNSVVHARQAGELLIATGGTADGSGNLTVTLSASATVPADGACLIYEDPDRLPSAWERGSTSFACHRRELIGIDLSCQADGAQTVPLRRLNIKSLQDGDVINHGDEIVRGATRLPIVSPTVAAGGGLATIEIGGEGFGSGNFTDGESLTIQKPAFPDPPERAETYGILIPTGHVSAQPGVADVVPVTPPITVLYDTRLASLWYAAGFTYLKGANSTEDLYENPASGLRAAASLFLIEDPGGSTLGSIRDVDRTLTVDETDVVLRAEYPMTQNRRVKMGVNGVNWREPNNWIPGTMPMAVLRWCMIWLGTDSDTPVIDGSWGTDLDQFGLAALQAFGPDTGEVIQLELRDTAMEPGVVVAHRKVVLGADGLLFNDKLGINRRVRIRGVAWDPTHRRKPRLFVEGREQTLSGRLAE